MRPIWGVGLTARCLIFTPFLGIFEQIFRLKYALFRLLSGFFDKSGVINPDIGPLAVLVELLAVLAKLLTEMPEQVACAVKQVAVLLIALAVLV